MNNVVVYIKRGEERENLYLEHIQSIFNCCLHKKANIIEFYVEPGKDNAVWNEFVSDAKKIDRKWNEVLIPSFEVFGKTSEEFKTKINILRKLEIKVTSTQIYNDFYEYIRKNNL